VIHRHGIDSENVAFQIEAALIDAYPGLTNVVTGHRSGDYGVRHSHPPRAGLAFSRLLALGRQTPDEHRRDRDSLPCPQRLLLYGRWTVPLAVSSQSSAT
jgi:hypothetical protein